MKTGRIAASVIISTALVGLISYYTTVYILDLLPENPILEIGIFVIGIINSVAGGYLASLVWRKNLRFLVKG